MTDPRQNTPLTPGPDLSSRPATQGISAAEIIATLLSIIWLLGALVFFVFIPNSRDNFNGMQFVTVMLTIFLPVAMIWVAAMSARSVRVMREESARLQAAIDGIRSSYIQQQQSTTLGHKPEVEQKLEALAEAAEETKSVIATFASTRQAQTAAFTPSRPAPLDDQPALALGTPAEDLSPPLPTDDLIRALNFPENAEDLDGFTSLRMALKDRKASQVITAAQDILTLLSQDGIYMDDLRYDRAKPELWRRFAKGERGRMVAQLGGVHDRSSLALTAGRMREDVVFRDAAHHFLRKFDKMVLDFEPEATDANLAALSTTRTAVAFMLLGRVAGIFN
ncbi:hypothetical protein [Algirhabdus cladophorae]|uniref:hypothetical protein n=1 Tax=Algirhabdus cladophorae TaxID=3377108 RepID=UPI003B845DB7